MSEFPMVVVAEGQNVRSASKSRFSAGFDSVMHERSHRCEFSDLDRSFSGRCKWGNRSTLWPASCALDPSNTIRAYVSSLRVVARSRKHVVPLDVCAQAGGEAWTMAVYVGVSCLRRWRGGAANALHTWIDDSNGGGFRRDIRSCGDVLCAISALAL